MNGLPMDLTMPKIADDSFFFNAKHGNALLYISMS